MPVLYGTLWFTIVFTRDTNGVYPDTYVLRSHHPNLFAYDLFQYYLDVGISSDFFLFTFFFGPNPVVQIHHCHICT